jgi:UDP-N-acetylmuramyl pentapeptide synthase
VQNSQRLRYAAAILVGRAVKRAARMRKSDGGTAVPGLTVNRIAPGLLTHALGSFPRGLVIVSGSSGKSTTTKMLTSLLEAHGIRVFTNPSTANIAQGLMSAVLDRIDLSGRVNADLAVLEMDEGHGAKIADRLSPHTVVLTNVMTDQIDRFSDPRKLTEMLRVIAARAGTRVVSNADDANLEHILGTLSDVELVRYGVTDEILAAAPHGLGYLSTSAERIAGGIRVLESGDRSAVIEIDGEPLEIGLPARGIHYAVDAAAALGAATALLGRTFDRSIAQRVFAAMPPVFARGEVVTVQGKPVEFVLVQNPSSFQLNVDELPKELDQVMVAMGSDVRDPSYLWPVDPSSLGTVKIVSGSIAEEVALHLTYRDVDVERVEPDLGTALDDFLALPDPARGIKTIVFSADSMRRTRTHWSLA